MLHHSRPEQELTLGCRRYFRFVVVVEPPAPEPTAFGSPCLPLLSGADSSPLRYEASALAALPSAMGKGRSEVCPRVSAIALWSFCADN